MVQFHRVRRYAPALAVSGLLLPALMACGGAEPSTTPPATESASDSESPSPSPTATPPTLPSAAEDTSPAAAKAFARHWVDVLNYASATLSTAQLRSISMPGCESCQAIIARIDDAKEQQGHFEGKGWTVTFVKYQPLQPRLKPLLSVSVKVAPQTVYESEGATPKSFDGGLNHLTFRLARSQDEWKLAEMDRLG